MIAIDTNVLVSFLQAGRGPQSDRASALVRSTRCFVSVTVLLETEWVLGRVLKLSRPDIRTTLQALLDTEAFVVERAAQVRLALHWADGGVDFADALHLAAADGCSAMATFDRAFVRRAAAVQTSVAVQEL